MASTGWSRFKQGTGWLVLGVVFAVLMVIGVGGASPEPSPEERIESISKRIACPICDGESVFDSRNATSEALRAEIRAQVQAGQASDDEILTFIQQRYGEQVLLVPRAEGLDALVWILPVVAAVGGAAGLAVAFRRWRREAGGVATDDDRALVAAARRAGLDTADSPYDAAGHDEPGRDEPETPISGADDEDPSSR